MDKSFEIVRYLVAKSADVNAKDNSGKTQLMHFFITHNGKLRKEHFDIIKFFIENGLDINVKYTSFRVGTLLAIIGDQISLSYKDNGPQTYLFDIVKLLVNNGADVNAKGLFGDTLLSNLCYSLHYRNNKQNRQTYFDIVKLLIENGADINYSIKGVTILGNICAHIAIHDKSDEEKQIHFKVAKLLIENGADINTRWSEYSDEPLLDFVIRMRNTELIELFTQK